jgi:hypothetical protein
MTPVSARSSTLGRLAAFLLVVLIVSPFTAPFSVMSGELQASPSGPADSVKSETTQTQTACALVEATVVHVEPSWTVVRFHAPAPTTLVEFAHVNRVLRL